MNNTLAMILSGVAALGITGILGFGIIPWLRKLKFGQTILEEGPKWHKSKQGTPTMGGIMFIIGIFVSAALVLVINYLTGNKLGLNGDMNTKIWAGLIMALMFGLVGFADDYIKVVKKRNLGLSIAQKSVVQLAICAGYLTSLFLAMGKEKQVPVIKGKEIAVQKEMGFGLVSDERFCDGLYFALSLRKLRRFMQNPAVLEKPLDKKIEDVE